MERYAMPLAGLGDRVLFFVDNERTHAHPAVVVEASPACLTLKIMVRNGQDQTRYQVLHVTDPRLASEEIRRNGSWEYHPDTLLLRQLRSDVQLLRERVKELESEPAAAPVERETKGWSPERRAKQMETLRRAREAKQAKRQENHAEITELVET